MNLVLEEALPSSLHPHTHFPALFTLAQTFCEPDKLTHAKTNLDKKFQQYQLPKWFVTMSHK